MTYTQKYEAKCFGYCSGVAFLIALTFHKAESINFRKLQQAQIKRVSFKRSQIVTIQHLLRLNICAITELTITIFFCLNVKCVSLDVLTRTSLLLQQAE